MINLSEKLGEMTFDGLITDMEMSRSLPPWAAALL